MTNETRANYVTPQGRIIFDKYLFEGDPEKNGKKSAAILIPNNEDLSALAEMCKEVAKAKWPKGVPKGARMPIKETDPSTHEDRPHMKDMYILNAGTKFEIPVYDTNGNVLSREDIKAGDDVKFSLSAWAYDVSGSKGVALNLEAVLKVADNEAFQSRPTANTFFGNDIKGDSEFNNFGF